MAIIYSYPEVTPTLSDAVIGTQFDNEGNPTKSFLIGDIVNLAATSLPPGPTGPQGSTGPAGPIGPQGPTGSSGSAGPQGQQGVPGPVGPAGLNWQSTWVSGTTYVIDDAVGYGGASWFCILGTSGTTPPSSDPTHWSLLASQGATGPQGPAGSTGSAGATGSQGPAGLTGAQGPQGTTGLPGSTGSQGPQGPVGPAGSQGLQGAAGTAGAQGTPGVPGPVGPAGLNWQGQWVPGNVYVVDDAVGYNGASYFCIAATGGYTAPNVDTLFWALLASQGAIGPAGIQGPTGLTGSQGPAGNTGPAGPQGPIGPTGLTGATGPAGSSGGITSINALTNTSQILTTGVTGNNFSVVSSGNTHTFNLPDTSATARGVLNTGSQNINGIKTFLFTPIAPTASLVANDTQLTTTTWVRSVAACSVTFPNSVGNPYGCNISGGFLQLTPAGLTTPGIVTNTSQTFSGSKVFTSNITVNGITVGRGALSGTNCVSVGSNSLVGNTSPYNTCIGDSTMPFNISGQSNVAVGFQALYFNTGFNNVGIGQSALFNLAGGTNNIGIGFNAGVSVSGSANNNICIGTNAGSNIGTGSNNVHIGNIVGSGFSSPSNEIAIGYNAVGLGSNTTVIGNGSTLKTILKGTVGVGVTNPDVSAILHVESTSKGFLPPKMSTLQKNAIASPTPGLIVYDTTLNKLCVRGASAWETITSI
jgi:hypothetical protein